jgi:hypothetical protein
MMEATTQEIAALLRSTDDMAAQFIDRVQARVGAPVSDAEILTAMKKISAKSLSMDKVVAKLQQQQEAAKKRKARQETSPAGRPAKSTRSSDTPAPSGAKKQPGTILEKLESVLEGNWDRAEEEGLNPQRMSAEAFVNAIYQYTDRREGTRRRILEAATRLDNSDVILTPALVADAVHELYES